LTSQTAAATSATSAAASATAAATSATSAAASATSAATTYDDFDDRYLGSKSSAPTVDNDSNTLLVGAIYWNSTLNNMYVWSGSAWVQIATTSVYTAPTIGSTAIPSGTTVTTIAGLTLNTSIINGPTITATGQTPVIHGILIPSTHSIFFEGTTDDAFETTFGVINPTADRTISLPDANGTIALDATVTDLQTMTLMGAL
jgi:hypothetical protein